MIVVIRIAVIYFFFQPTRGDAYKQTNGFQRIRRVFYFTDRFSGAEIRIRRNVHTFDRFFRIFDYKSPHFYTDWISRTKKKRLEFKLRGAAQI